MQQPAHIVVADGHPVVRLGVRTMLAHISDLRVVGDTSSSDELLRLCADLQPNVVTIALNLSSPPIHRLVADIHAVYPDMGIVIFASSPALAHARDLIDGGCAGFVLKHEPPPTIIRAIRAAARGRVWYSPATIEYLAHIDGGSQHASTPPISARERDVLHLIVEGQTNKAIGYYLGIHVKTVEKHVAALFRKLGAGSRTVLALRARELEIV